MPCADDSDGVDLQFHDLAGGQTILRQHALDGLAQHLFRSSRKLLGQCALAQPAGVATVAVVDLLLELLAGDVDLLRIHDHHEITGVHVGGVPRLALASEEVGDLRGQTAERLALGIDQVPALFNLARLCGVRLQ